MHDSERITLARLPSGVSVETTVHVYDGDAPGPTLYVQAAQHGREINGAATLRRVHEELLARADAFAGRLVAVPVADPLTFDRVSYTAPEPLDSVNANMNRCWPGDADGSLHERMAARLWEYATDADAIVDLHTGSRAMLTHTVFLRGDAECRALAEAFGTDLLLAEAAGDDAGTEWTERGFGGKFRVAATREGIPAVTPELAHNKELVADAIETGVAGVLDVCRDLDMLPGDPDSDDGSPTVARNHLGRSTADDSGLFAPREDLALGDRVTRGDRLGEVFDPTTYETVQTVTAERDGLVYSVAREATVTGGQNLVGIAVVEEGGDA